MEKYTIVKSGKDYEVVEQYLYLSLLAAFGITKEKIKYKVATLRSIYPNKGGNYEEINLKNIDRLLRSKKI